MKKYLLLLISTFAIAQINPQKIPKLAITAATKLNNATRIMVQDSITKEVHWVLKSTVGTGTVTSVTGIDGITVAAGTTTPVIGISSIAQSKVTGLTSSLASKIDASLLGANSGVATLDSGGKVPLSQINDALLGSVNYKGTYNASTNTPALPTVGSGNKGFYFIVSTAGTQVGLTLNAGDWVISNGVSWNKVDNNNAVTSVNGFVGSVVLTKSDVGLSNVDNTSDANKPISTATQTALNLKSNIASPTFTGVPTAPTATAGTNTTQIASTAFVQAANAPLVAQTITNGVTTSAPSQDVVFDNLALKANLTGSVFSGVVESIGFKTNGNYVLSTTNTGFIAPNNGNITFYANAPANAGWTSNAPITATSFIKSGATATNILLAGGTDIPQSTFQMALGYTSENTVNKQNSLLPDLSNLKYPTVTGVGNGILEYFNKNINAYNLVPFGVDSSVGQVVNTIGVVETIGGNYKYKSFTNVIDPNTIYTLDGSSITQGIRISYRNSSNAVIGYYSTPTEVVSADGNPYQIHDNGPIIFTTPSNCVTILVNTVGADGVDPTAKLTLTKGFYPVTFYSNFSKWVGKRIHWLGDSMTQNNVMQPKVQKDLKTVNFLDGIGGSLITPNYENIVGDGNRRASFVERAKNNTLYPSDMNVIYGGYNDYGYSAPIGNITDVITPTFDANGRINASSVVGATFCGSLNYIIKYFASTFTDKPIKLITATYNNSGAASTYAAQEAYANAMINVAVRNNIPVLDLFHGSGINSDNATAHTLDGVHFNDAGATLVAQKVTPFLNTNIGNTVAYMDALRGTGTVNYLPKISANGVYSNSSVFNNGASVGIGTTSPFSDSALTLTPTNGQSYPLTVTNSANTANGKWKMHVDVFASNDEYFGISASTGSAKFRISTAGIVGIDNLSGATSVPVFTDVNGNLIRGTVSVSPYKVYAALLTQTGTAAPVATVLENTLGGTLVWTRTSTGIYTGTLTGVFTVNKTTVSFSNGSSGLYNFGSYSNTINTISIGSQNSSTANVVDDAIFKATIEIRVYN